VKSKFERILCPIDFTDNSLMALDQAIGLARLSAAVLYLMNVEFVPDNMADVKHYVSVSTEAPKAQLEELARKRLAGVRHQIVVDAGRPAELIEKAAKDLDVDLIVMATHGRTGVSHFFLGSVAEHVVRTAGCPVLTFRPDARLDRLRKLLCPVDFDQSSIDALKYAFRLARQNHAQLTVLHVDTLPFEPSEIPVHQPLPEWKKEMLVQLQRLIDDNLGRDARCELVVEQGDAARNILEVIADLHPDIVVMATHGRSGLGHFFLGSVAERTVRESSVPVLTLRASDPGASAGERGKHPTSA
jgi:nucleotide-binding universal stress UspA family protein